MSIEQEFATVDALLNIEAETRSVDAFALSLIKTERQMRKLFTNLVFQDPAFTLTHVPGLRRALAANQKVYFEGFEAGLNALFDKPVKQLIGEPYDHLRRRIDEAAKHRNKIFHGQVTGEYLDREALEALVADPRRWCGLLADAANKEFGYDGFGRNSFRKNAVPDLSRRYRVSIKSIPDYKKFIAEKMARANRRANESLRPTARDARSG